MRTPQITRRVLSAAVLPVALAATLAAPAQAAPARTAAAPTTDAAASGTAAAQAIGCNGRLIARKVAFHHGSPIAELVVYYKDGHNCARLNHLGITRGVRLRTSVFLAACRQTRPGPHCTFYGRPAAQDGHFTHFAGPVYVRARGRCIHAAGDIYFYGKRHLETYPAASHCR
ncbi:hypothetical protein ACQEU3_44010 [Spirillospora sp. CA-253888]